MRSSGGDGIAVLEAINPTVDSFLTHALLLVRKRSIFFVENHRMLVASLKARAPYNKKRMGSNERKER